MFTNQEPGGRGPPSKHLVQIFRGGSSPSGFLIRPGNIVIRKPPRGGDFFRSYLLSRKRMCALEGHFRNGCKDDFETDARNKMGYFDGCAPRTFGQRICARNGANPGCTQPTSRMRATYISDTRNPVNFARRLFSNQKPDPPAWVLYV